MSAFKYVTQTWLLSQLLNVVIALFTFPFGSDVLFITLYTIFSLVFSITAYAFCLLIIGFVSRLEIADNWKLFLWIIITFLAIYGGSWLTFVLFFGFEAYEIIHPFLIPAFCAAFLSIVLRTNQFKKMLEEENDEYSY